MLVISYTQIQKIIMIVNPFSQIHMEIWSLDFLEKLKDILPKLNDIHKEKTLNILDVV